MKRVHVECLPDESFAKKSGISRKNLQHHNDKGRVCNVLQKGNNLLGIIDEDPGEAQPKYLNTLKAGYNNHGFKIFTDSENGNKLIVMCPRLEDWLINVCNKNQINIIDYGLSNEANKLHREINSKIIQFEKLLQYMITTGCVQIMELKRSLHKSTT